MTYNMESAADLGYGFIEIQSSPKPEISLAPVRSPITTPPAPVDPKDPEGFLKRCSGFCKKTKLRCSAVIGKKSQQNTHPTFLSTCSTHRDQQSFAGWCQCKLPNGERCARLFRWSPPYFELCEEHQGHPDTPCYFIQQLPLEIRHEIYRYLLPTKPIGSSTAAVHQVQAEPIPPFAHFHTVNGQRYYRVDNAHNAPLWTPQNNLFPMPLLDLLLVSRQMYKEVKDLLFSIATFKIDVRKDGTFMCGRRLLEPKRADGSSHFLADEADSAKKRFLKTFDWRAVKNYTVDILLENWANSWPHFVTNHVNCTVNPAWDEEVEIYDIRDYVSVVVSGILAKSINLCKLQVRVCLADFEWERDQILANAGLLVSPFARLRNVRQPNLGGVFQGKPDNNSMFSVAQGGVNVLGAQPGSYAICSVPSLPTDNPILVPGMQAFDAYAAEWRRWICSSGSAPMSEDPQIRRMFTELKDFYTHLSTIVRDVTHRHGRQTFLHRARVARENEDVVSFREIRSELIHYWETYLVQEERKKMDMDRRLGKLLSSDSYPSHEWEDASPRKSPAGQFPVLLDADTMARDGIPMTGNSGEKPALQQRLQIWAQRLTRHFQHPGNLQDALQNPTGDQARFYKQLQDVAGALRRTRRGMGEQGLYATPITDAVLNPTLEFPGHGLCASAYSSPFALADVPFSKMREGEPGPSRKRLRVDSGFEEADTAYAGGGDGDAKGYGDGLVDWDACSYNNNNMGEIEGGYVGKGKAKMAPRGAEVIVLD